MSLGVIRDCMFSFFFFGGVPLKKDFERTERRVSGAQHGDIELLCPWFDSACSQFYFEHKTQNLPKHSWEIWSPSTKVQTWLWLSPHNVSFWLAGDGHSFWPKLNTRATLYYPGSAMTTSVWQHSAPGLPPSSDLWRDVEKPCNLTLPCPLVWWEQQSLPDRLTVITTIKCIPVLKEPQGTVVAYLLLFPILLLSGLLNPPAMPA